MLLTGGDGDAFIFRGFDGRYVITSPEKTVPGPTFISYAQFSKYLALWFGASLGLSPKEFSTICGSQSGRSGVASATSNARVSMELWGQHGDWKSVKSQKNYLHEAGPGGDPLRLPGFYDTSPGIYFWGANSCGSGASHGLPFRVPLSSYPPTLLLNPAVLRRT